jgi:hypothetical protein
MERVSDHLLISIGEPTLVGNRLSFSIDGGPASEIWFEVQDTYADWLTADRSDAALLAVLPWAMRAGRAIRCRAGVTSRLLYELAATIIPLLVTQKEELTAVPIDAKPLPFRSSKGTAVMTGLSSGIDSFSTIANHREHRLRELRITHFSYHDVGSHGLRDGTSVFAKRLQRARALAMELAMPLVEVRTNLSQWVATNYLQHHTILNAAAAAALANGVETYLYSSTIPLKQIHGGKARDIAVADPIVLAAASSTGVWCVSANAALSRMAKTELVASDPLVQRWLDVCVDPSSAERNCSVCWKCCRTELTLEILGRLGEFSRVFDLAAYRRVRRRYVTWLLKQRNDPHLGEILARARQNGMTIDTPWLRFCAVIHRSIGVAAPYLPAGLRWRVIRHIDSF